MVACSWGVLTGCVRLHQGMRLRGGIGAASLVDTLLCYKTPGPLHRPRQCMQVAAFQWNVHQSAMVHSISGWGACITAVAPCPWMTAPVRLCCCWDVFSSAVAMFRSHVHATCTPTSLSALVSVISLQVCKRLWPRTGFMPTTQVSRSASF